MFRRIEQIKIGGEKPGEAFGGQIFTVGANIGGNGQPTSIDVNVISKDGIYDISQSDLSAIKSVKIAIGEEGKGLVFKKMYLISYNISNSSNAKVLHLNYKDHTIFFDKIFVGCINEHGNPDSLLPDGEEGKIIKDFTPRKELSVKIPIQCMPCSKTDLDPNTGLKAIKVIDHKFLADTGYITNVHPTKGGVILLGTEEYKQSECELADVKYSFDELIHVLEKVGIEIKEDKTTKIKTLHNRGKSHKREKYSGTLKEVLNKWCGDLGFSWYWDWDEEKIVGVDNLNPNIDISNIKNKINNLNEDSNIIVTSSDQSFSLEGTYVQESHSYIRKDARIEDGSQTSYKGTTFVNIQINDLLDNAYFGGGRTTDELLISSALAKFNKDLRRIYNWFLVSSKTNNDFTTDSTSLEHLGCNAYHKCNSDEAEILIGMDHGQGQMNTSFPNYKQVYGATADVYFVNYSKELLERWEAWESEVAGSIGKYYLTPKLAADGQQCHPNYQRARKQTAEPKSEVFSSTSKTNLPFSAILEKHPDGALTTVDAQDYNVKQAGQSFIIGLAPSVLARGGSYKFKQDDPSNSITFKLYEDQQLTSPVSSGFTSRGTPGTEAAESNWLIPENYPHSVVYYKGASGPLSFSIADAGEIGDGDLVFIHDRNPSWGTSQKDVDELITDIATGSSKLKPYIPKYEVIHGNYSYGTLKRRITEDDRLAGLRTAFNANEGQEYESCIVIVPKFSELSEVLSISEIKGNSIDGFGGTVNTNEKGFYKSKVDQPIELGGGGAPSSCLMNCSSTLFDEVCRCLPNQDFEVKPSGTGLLTRLARYITVSVGDNSLNMIFPVEGMIRGYYTTEDVLKKVQQASEHHFGKHKNAGEAMSYIMNWNDITSRLDELTVDRNKAPTGKSTNYEKVDNLPGVPGEGHVITNVIVPNESWAEGVPTSTAISASNYHDLTAINIESITPTESFKFNIAGLDYTDIKEFLNPSAGMDSFTLNYGIDGVTTDLSFSNGRLRADAIKLQRELSLKNIEPSLSLNRFGRTF